MVSTLALLFGEMIDPYVDHYFLASTNLTENIRAAYEFAVEERELLEKVRSDYGASQAYFVSGMDRQWSRVNAGFLKNLPDVKLYFEEGKAPEAWTIPDDAGIGGRASIRDKGTGKDLYLYAPEVGSEDFVRIKNMVDDFCAKAAAFLQTEKYQPGDVSGEPNGHYGWTTSMWHDLYGFKPHKESSWGKCYVCENSPTLYNIGDEGFLLSMRTRSSQKFETPASLADCRKISERDFKSISGYNATDSEARFKKLSAGRSPRSLWERMTFKYTL